MFEQFTEELEAKVDALKSRSAWSKGVEAYAHDLIEHLYEHCEYEGEIPCNRRLCEKALLNGAENWNQYSWGGSSLCYDGQIAERLCNPSELRKTQRGALRPNKREEWLDVQARALYQASLIVLNAYDEIKDKYI